MKNIKRLTSILLIIISVWIIRDGPLYIVAKYPFPASILICAIIYLSFALGLSTFSSKNRTLENIRITTIVLSFIGIFPGIYFNYIYFMRAKDSFLLREGITGMAVVTDKKIGISAGRNNNIDHSYYELHFSFLTNENIISKSLNQVSEKQFEAVNEGDSINVVYLPGRTDIVELIISQADSTFYATKLRPIR